MESFENRLKRFVDQDPLEIPGWLTVSMSNFILPEIHAAKENRLYQLVFLGTHSIMQTISEKLFGLRGVQGTRFYLESFVDGPIPDQRFSSIAEEIHVLRNVMAHQWWSSSVHNLALDHTIAEGWKRDGNNLSINPQIYADRFQEAFRTGAIMELYRNSFSDTERVIRKFYFIREWLELKGTDPVALEIGKLRQCKTDADVATQETVTKEAIRTQYNL